MSSTLQSLQEQVMLNAYDPAVYNGFATHRLNEAAREVADRVAWGSTLRGGTVQADGSVLMLSPVVFTRIGTVWMVDPQWSGADDDGAALGTYWSAELPFGGAWGRPGAQGRAAWFTRQGPSGQQVRTVQVRPGVKIAVEGYRRPAEMALPTDFSELGVEADSALVAFARAKIALHENDSGEHAVLMGEFDRLVKRYSLLVQPDIDAPSQVPGHVGGC